MNASASRTDDSDTATATIGTRASLPRWARGARLAPPLYVGTGVTLGPTPCLFVIRRQQYRKRADAHDGKYGPEAAA